MSGGGVITGGGQCDKGCEKVILPLKLTFRMSNSLRNYKTTGQALVIDAIHCFIGIHTLNNEEMGGFTEPSPTGAQRSIHSPPLCHKEKSNKKLPVALKGVTIRNEESKLKDLPIGNAGQDTQKLPDFTPL